MLKALFVDGQCSYAVCNILVAIVLQICCIYSALYYSNAFHGCFIVKALRYH